MEAGFEDVSEGDAGMDDRVGRGGAEWIAGRIAGSANRRNAFEKEERFRKMTGATIHRKRSALFQRHEGQGVFEGHGLGEITTQREYIPSAFAPCVDTCIRLSDHLFRGAG